MDGFREPSGMLTVFNSIGLVGLAIYNDRQLKSVNEDIVSMKQDMNGISNKFVEFKDHGDKINQLIQIYTKMEAAANFLTEKIEEIQDERDDDREVISSNFSIISDAMKSVGNDVRLDKINLKKKKKRGKNNKKDKSRRRKDETSDESSSDDDSVKRELDRRRKNKR